MDAIAGEDSSQAKSKLRLLKLDQLIAYCKRQKKLKDQLQDQISYIFPQMCGKQYSKSINERSVRTDTSTTSKANECFIRNYKALERSHHIL